MVRLAKPPTLICPGLLRRVGERWTLLGSRCLDCNELYFPSRASCTRCCDSALIDQDLGDQGSLWSWTVQTFLPKSPCDIGGTAETFRPYGVGYVQLVGGLKVESRLVANDLGKLRIGAPMSLTLDPYRFDADGAPVHTYAFQLADTAPSTPIDRREVTDGRP
jgi:uncharacterized OB-fold protein